MERFFNTAGPNIAEDNYTLDPLSRFDLDEILTLIRQKRYFVLHAPRQTGKTSCLLALRDYLNERDDYVAVYANVEGGQAARNNVGAVVAGTVNVIATEMADIVGEDIPRAAKAGVQDENESTMLSAFLTKLSKALPKPLVLFIDEIDSLVGDSLVSVLRQLRAGYADRPAHFPQSIVLCGVRDVRDYRIHTTSGEIITGGSAFNIKAKSLRLGDFSLDEIRALYGQHTAETGQRFDEGCFPFVWQATEGQPWLVNALGNEVTNEMRENRDRSVVITPEMMYRAQERIIYRRDTHIDQILEKMKEPAMQRVMNMAVSKDFDIALANDITSDDIIEANENGLITLQRGQRLRVANSIYNTLFKELASNHERITI